MNEPKNDDIFSLSKEQEELRRQAHELADKEGIDFWLAYMKVCQERNS